MRKTVFALAGAALLAVPAHADEYKIGDLVIDHPVARATPAKAPVSGGYMTITNIGSEPDRLIGGTAELAKSVEVHEMKMDGDVMKMREITGLAIDPGATVKLLPGGYHIMFMGLDGQLKEGNVFKGTLEFEKAGSIEIKFNVETLTTIRKTLGEAMHDHSKMSN